MSDFVSVHSTARIGEGSTIGPFTVIEAGAVIGSGVTIGSHCRIHAGTRISDRASVGDRSLLGVPPEQRVRNSVRGSMDQDLVALRIGPDSVVGCGVILYKGSEIDSQVTIGDLTWICERCRIGQAAYLGCRVSLSHDVIIEEGVQLHPHSYLDAYTYVEGVAVLSSGVVVVSDLQESGDRSHPSLAKRRQKGPHIGKGAHIGSGAILLPGSSVRAESLIQAGELIGGSH